MRALIDTCVIVDALQSRKPFNTDAENIFLAAANDFFTGCISAKAVTDIYYLMHCFTHDNNISRNTLSKLFSLFEVLDTAGIDCRKAIPSSISDYEDAVMIETAVRTETDCIVTRNGHDYKNCPIPVYTPKEFLNLITENS